MADPVALLRDAFDLLENHLGDTDLDYFESEEEEREAVPVQVAARLVMQAIQALTDGVAPIDGQTNSSKTPMKGNE
jgi:hypothetical protein